MSTTQYILQIARHVLIKVFSLIRAKIFKYMVPLCLFVWSYAASHGAAAANGLGYRDVDGLHGADRAPS